MDTATYPADMLVYTTVPEHSQPRPLCWPHTGARQANGTVVVHDAVNVRVKGRSLWECADCTDEHD